MSDPRYEFLRGAGAAGERIRSHAWSSTPLGDPAAWPGTLKTLVGMMLASRQPMFVAWGPRRTLIYNEAYSGVLAGKDGIALGRDLLDVWAEIRDELAPLVAQAYGGQSVHFDRMEVLTHRRGRPELTHWSFFYSPVRDDAGGVSGLFCACNDITGLVEAERREASAAERLQLALDAGAIIGTWVWEVPANHFVADERFARSFGLEAEVCRNGLSIEKVMESIDPEHLPKVQAAIAEAMAHGGPYRCEYRVRQHDGVFRWIEANGRVELDGQGAPVRFPGVLLDIEERRRAQAERDDANALIRTTLEAVPGLFYAKDLAGRIILANHGVSRTLALPLERIVGRTTRELVADPEQADALVANDLRIMDSGRAEAFEERMAHADGSQEWWLSTKAPLRDGSGGVVGLIGSSINITDRKREQAERKQLLESERAARAEAERASTLKDEFLATLSHELRTPLSAILGWVHLLRRKAGDTPDLHRGIDVIERSTRAQTQLIEDLLDMSRITAGKLRLERQPLALAVVAEAALEAVRPAAVAAGVRLELVVEQAVPPVMGDAGRLQQVLQNLLTNAVKFSLGGSVVLLRLGAGQGWMRAEVVDEGVGIEPDFLPHVFDRFRQADGSTTRRFGGLGLGLAIVRHLVELHGGRVQAFSEGPGRGARFVVLLPPAGMQEVQAADASPSHPPVEVDLAGLKVLVVDDEPDVLDLLQRVLRDARAEVLAAASADAALRLFREQRPEVVVSDIGMPETDGYELVRRLRALALDEGGATPAIALTALARREDRDRAIDSGFTLHLAKPVEAGLLLASVAELAGRPVR